MLANFFVADSLGGGGSECAVGIQELLNFGNESLIKHSIDACVDALVDDRTFPMESEDSQLVRRSRPFKLGLPMAEGAASYLGDFQGAGHASEIARQNAMSSERIDLPQAIVEGFDSVDLDIGLHGGSKFRIGIGTKKETAEEGLEIEGGTADKEGRFASLANILRRLV